MNPQRWKVLEALYFGALDAPDRRAFLDQACGGDAEIRSEVESLLGEDPATIHLLDRLASDGLRLVPPRQPLTRGGSLGQYEIVDLLGSGGSADVYKAWDPILERHVALKVFTNAAIGDEFRARFAREAKAAAALNHPNIATVYEVGEADDYWFIAIEFVEGVTFRDKLDDPDYSTSERLRVLAQAAQALALAHSRGIVHCDLKPENVMVTPDGFVKILDFGLARLLRSRVPEHAPAAGAADVEWTNRRIEGTIGYMSPEQAAGDDLGPRTDVFAFGCMLFEAVANRLPFWSPSIVRSLHNLTHEPAPRLDAFTRKSPPRLQQLIDDCLSKDASARPASMEDVSSRLEEVIAQRPQLTMRIAAAIVVMLAIGVPVAYWRSQAQPSFQSVAVIPFSTSPDSADGAILAEEISEGLINTLTELPDLTVTARASSFRFAADNADVQRIARTLGVRTLVTGRVTTTNGGLRVAAELIDGNNGSALWGAEYTRRVTELGDLQAQLAGDIAKRVRLSFTPSDQRRLAKTIHPNPEVYALLLRGRYQMSLYSPDSTQKAAAYFEQALGIDPSYAVANAELANTYRRLGGSGVLNPREALPLAERSAMRAIAADDELAEAHTALADIKRDGWDWATSMREYQRAIALSASYVPAHEGLAIQLSVMGRGHEALAELSRIRALDPISVAGAIDVVALFYNVRQFDRAVGAAADALARDNEAPALWAWRGIALGGGGDLSGALAAFDRARELGDSTAATECYAISALARTGRRDEAMRRLAAIEHGSAFVPPSSLAIAYAGVGEKNRALDALERGFADRDPLLQYIVVEPFLDPISDDARFRALVAGMGLSRR